MKKKGAFFVILAVLCAACTRSPKPVERVAAPSDTIYTILGARTLYSTDPDRALVLADSAYLIGNSSAYERDLTRATIYGRSQINPQRDKALEICMELLQSDSTSVDNMRTAKHRLEVLSIVTDIYRLRRDTENWTKYIVESIELNRAMGFETDALRTEAEMGMVLVFLGQNEAGMQKLDAVLEALSKGEPSVDRLDAWVVCAKRKINMLTELNRHQEVIPLSQEIIDKLDYYQAHARLFAEDSYRLPPIAEDRTRWCDYYRCQAHGFQSLAYAYMGNLPEAKRELSVFETYAYSRSYGGRRMISPVWKRLGEWNKLLAIDDAIEKRLGTDTLNGNYTLILHDRSEAARARGHLEEALAWMARYADVQQKVDQQLLESQTQEYAESYLHREKEREVLAAKEQAHRMRVYVIVFLVLFVSAVITILVLVLQRKQIFQKNQALVRLINEKGPAEKSTRSDGPDERLFRQIDTAIREERLYANANLQRQDILDRWSLRRQTLNELLSAYAGGDSFPAYINTLRLEEAVHQLRENPERTLLAIAESTGFTAANFRLQFKQRFGMTPQEYRENL